jgi:LuxR family maltose regulon positive regulatory protein
LTGLRLAAATGDPRIDRAATPLDRSVADAGWFRQQILLARAEAELSAGQPGAVLELLSGETPVTTDVSVLRARAWLAVGELAAVAAALRTRPVEPLPVLTQVQLELIEARLAQAHGRTSAQRALIDRALRVAGREQLRTPIAWAKTWLHSALATDPALLAMHGPFLASIRTLPAQGGAVTPNRTRPAPEVDLTDRELEILQRLGSLGTNSEIAAELFLSTNTVKTHLKSVYRKLDVSRRSDAFRRGRSLGLC